MDFQQKSKESVQPQEQEEAVTAPPTVPTVAGVGPTSSPRQVDSLPSQVEPGTGCFRVCFK